ncbi:hypothetical protein ACHAW6_000464, partial [Cyclotella cf. meneghiniana]
MPAVLGIDGPIDDKLRTLLVNGVENGGLAIRDPTLATASLYSTSVEATEMLIGTLIQNEPINVEAHWNCVRAAGVKHWKTRRNGEVAFHTALMERLPPKVKKRMERATAAGAWLSTIPDRVSGTKLTNSPRMSGSITPPSDTDGAPPTSLTNVTAVVQASRWSMDSAESKACLLESAMTIIALTTLQVMIEPTIFYGNGSRAGGYNATPTTPHTINPTNTLGDEARGDVLAHSFWNQGKGTVFDVCICDTNSRSYGNTSLSKILERQGKEKKDKYETACLDRYRDFTALVYSVDGMASKDTRTAKQCIAWLLAKKWSHTYSDMTRFIHRRMSLAVVRSNTLLLR